MYNPKSTNIALKRRRLELQDEEVQQPAQKLRHLDGSQQMTGSPFTLPAVDVYPTTFSQGNRGGLFPPSITTGSSPNNGYPVTGQLPYLGAATTPINEWVLEPPTNPWVPEPTPNDSQLFPPIAPTQRFPGRQSGQDAVVHSSFLPTNTMVAPNNNVVVPSILGQEVSEEVSDEQVCFGMVPSISGTCYQRQWSIIPSSPFLVQIKTSTHFISYEYPGISGYISPEHDQIIQGLLEEETLDLRVSCTIHISANKKPQYGRFKCTLDINVYGPAELFNNIGEWFEDHEVYLQDPRECHIDVKYYNPHRLSSHDLASCPQLSEAIQRNQDQFSRRLASTGNK